METKTVTLRLPQDVADFINRNDDGITQGVINIVSTLRRHEQHADIEIRNRFTPDEWKFLADSLNGTLALDDFRFSASALVAHNQDAQLYDGTASRWGIDIETLNKKCESLSASQVEALYRRVERFWAHPETDLDVWAKY